MRKLFGVVFMAIVCVSYFFMVRMDNDLQGVEDITTELTQDNDDGKEVNEVIKEEVNEELNEIISKRLVELEEEIANDYPEAPREVIAIHNELMQIAYNKSFNWNVDVYKLVDLLRAIYSEELNYLNSYDVQVAAMKDTLRSGVQAGEYLVYSTIKAVEIIDDYQAKAEVVHQMTHTKVIREYLLKKDENWKIYSWKNIEIMNPEIEETKEVE